MKIFKSIWKCRKGGQKWASEERFSWCVICKAHWLAPKMQLILNNYLIQTMIEQRRVIILHVLQCANDCNNTIQLSFAFWQIWAIWGQQYCNEKQIVYEYIVFITGAFIIFNLCLYRVVLVNKVAFNY